MKFQKKLFAALLACVMLFALCVPALAADAYADVTGDEWYAEATDALRERGIMDGVENNNFDADGIFTRAQLATVLYRMAGSPAVTGEDGFTDTDSGTWYSDAVLWSEQNNIVNGLGDGLYGTNEPATQEQLATMLWRDAGSYVVDSSEETGASEYAVNAVRWLKAENLISEDGSAFDPKATASRGQVADIVYRYLLLKEKYANVDATSGATQEAGESGQSGTIDGKILIAYFSRAGENYSVGVIEKGNTAIVAELIAEQTGGDLFEIVPVVPYPSDYEEMKTVSTRESDTNARPEIANTVENWDEYDVIFLGYPIWYGDMPMIVYNFLESYDFSGKTVVPFNTHEGSGQSGTQSKIAATIPDATVLSGLAIRGATAQNDTAAAKSAVEAWIEQDLKDALPEKAADTAAGVGQFDLEDGTVLLNSGYTMPILGIGTFTLSDEQASDSVYWALSDGYHLIDTAAAYNNETGVGEGIRRAIDEGLVEREDIFLTTKLWPSDYTMEGIDASLERLGVDYIDLLLLHQPIGDYIGGYQAMEQAVAEGKVHSIGLSNFRPEQFDEIMEIATIAPAVNQVETHPYYQEVEMIEYLKQYGTVLEAWYPLGGRGNTQTMFADETISAIAAAHDRTSAQIILRWHLQAGHIAIPGSNNPDHILENISIFDFELTDEEMAAITAIDRNDPFFGGFGNRDELEEAAGRW